MRKLLNTLYVTIPQAYLSKDGETVLVRVEQETRFRVPILDARRHRLRGPGFHEPRADGFCAEHNVGVSFLSEHGRFLARIQGPIHGNVLLRREQYRRADVEAYSAPIASSVLLAKIANGRTSLLRAAREHPSETLDRASALMGQSLRTRVHSATLLDGLRGVEGDAARGVFLGLRRAHPAAKGGVLLSRTQPPSAARQCQCVALVSVCAPGARCRLRAGEVGLDPAVGFLHRDRPGRAGRSGSLGLWRSCARLLADRPLGTHADQPPPGTPSGFTR